MERNGDRRQEADSPTVAMADINNDNNQEDNIPSSSNNNINQLLRAKWNRQTLDVPFRGAHTGVAGFDMNGDGYKDFLFAAGRHDVDMVYVYIHLGLKEDNETTTEEQRNGDKTTLADSLEFRFSEALPLEAGSFYQIDASHLSSLEDNHVAVLLAGGTCGNYRRCPQPFQPALLLDVSVNGCSVHQPDAECILSSQVIWEEPERMESGIRNGALSMDLGNGVDPAIVLVGKSGLSIYHPNEGGDYNTTNPDYLLKVGDKITEFKDAID